MGLEKIFQLCLLVLMQTAGQLFLKAGANKIVAHNGWLELLRSFISWPVFIGLVIYGTVTVLWLWVLRDIAISKAYMFMALCFVTIPLAGGWFFNEPITLPLIIGGAMIVFGLLVIAIFS